MEPVIFNATLERLVVLLSLSKKTSVVRSSSGYDPQDNAFMYRYIALDDPKTCEDCLMLDSSLYSGSTITSVFKHAFHIGGGIWMVQKHKKCRCVLICDNIEWGCSDKLADEFTNIGD